MVMWGGVGGGGRGGRGVCSWIGAASGKQMRPSRRSAGRRRRPVGHHPVLPLMTPVPRAPAVIRTAPVGGGGRVGGAGSGSGGVPTIIQHTG